MGPLISAEKRSWREQTRASGVWPRFLPEHCADRAGRKQNSRVTAMETANPNVCFQFWGRGVVTQLEGRYWGSELNGKDWQRPEQL